MVDTDRITGAAKDLAGKVQGAVGDLVGSNRSSVEGRARQAQGTAENVYGQAKDAARDVADRATDAVHEIGGKVRGAVDDLPDRDAVARRAGQAGDEAASYYGRAEEAVRQAADEAYDYAEDAYENSGRYLQQGRRAVAHQVEESPLVALLISGAVGYGLALLIHSRR